MTQETREIALLVCMPIWLIVVGLLTWYDEKHYRKGSR